MAPQQIIREGPWEKPRGWRFTLGLLAARNVPEWRRTARSVMARPTPKPPVSDTQIVNTQVVNDLRFQYMGDRDNQVRDGVGRYTGRISLSLSSARLASAQLNAPSEQRQS